VSTFRSSRRGIAAATLITALALGSTACGAGSDSEACDKVLSGGNVNTCFGISDVSTSEGDAVVLIGTQVSIVCKDGDSVGIIIPEEIVNANLSQVEWKYNGKNAAQGIDSSFFNSVPGGLPSCDSALKSA